jgi:endo-1,3(4)-beta-glucanase
MARTNLTRTTFLRTTGVIATGVIVTLITAACSGPGTRVDSSSSSVLSDSALGSTISQLPQKTVGEIPVTRLARGLAPPTNRWFSGLVFGERPLPVFPLPLSFGLTDSGFTFGLPEVTSSPDTITGGNAPSVTIDAGARTSKITAYDDASVTIAHQNDSGTTIGSTVIAEGSPLVSFTAAKKVTLRLGQPFASAGTGIYSAKVGKTTYGLRTAGAVSKAGTGVTLAPGATAVWFPVPTGSTLSAVAAYAVPLTAVTLDYSSGGSTASTTLRYATAAKDETLIAALPHQQKSMTTPKCSLGSYPSVYGTMTLCAATSLSWTSPTVAASDTIDLSSIGAAQKAELTATLAQDVAQTAALPADTYFGGKALYRLANLLMLADQLGATEAAKTVGGRLNDALRQWTDPTRCKSATERCFVYDPKIKGIVGLAASFGSEQFNDHNFHYGYFLYAASVAASRDKALRTEISPVMNLLAADLASSGNSRYFPDRRGFDAYAGHSWASGYSPFADGNNLESSSEAVNAWNALALWSDVSSNGALKKEASWMLASEAASARSYWTNFDTTDPVYSGYQRSVVALNWGGKRDYSTWFSADANAKLGIQLIPMNPASGYLSGDPKRIAKSVDEATVGSYDKQFGDYLLMYSALGGTGQAKAALATARTLPEKFIDDGNSRSYLLAWIMTRR